MSRTTVRPARPSTAHRRGRRALTQVLITAVIVGVGVAIHALRAVAGT